MDVFLQISIFCTQITRKLYIERQSCGWSLANVSSAMKLYIKHLVFLWMPHIMQISVGIEPQIARWCFALHEWKSNVNRLATVANCV